MHIKSIKTKCSEIKEQIWPFISLTKPGVMSLVVFSALTEILVNHKSQPLFLNFMLIVIIAMGSAGAAAVNMWYDKDIDSIMTRTKNRPTVLGIIQESTALEFGIFFSIVSVFYMTTFINIKAGIMLFVSIVYYSCFYTMYLKRKTPQNIVIGGAAGAFPPIIASLGSSSQMSTLSIILFLYIFLWTPPHFFALSLNKKQEYEDCMIPMMPNVYGDRYTKINMIFYTVSLFFVTHALIYFNIISFIGYCVIQILNSYFLYLNVKLYMDNKNTIAMKLFVYSIFYLFFVLTCIILWHN
jgi:protoheme IX farnesyltransferase